VVSVFQPICSAILAAQAGLEMNSAELHLADGNKRKSGRQKSAITCAIAGNADVQTSAVFWLPDGSRKKR
jgi:hypothetical protein